MNDRIDLRKMSRPAKSRLLAWSEFVQASEISPHRLMELIEMDWVDSVCTRNNDFLFPEPEIFKVRKLVRLCKDFELSTVGGIIIVDLLQQIEDLQREVRELRRLL
ncbi:MAG: chaperone modulator CbpM [Desulfonatronovibrionaceae bacterium]